MVDSMRICPTCGTQNDEFALFCRRCATALTEVLVCPACGANNRSSAQFCFRCRQPLKISVTSFIPATPGYGLLGTGMLPTNTLLHGRYVIVKKIAQGGMGAVYLATDIRLPGKFWAIKEMSDAGIAPSERAQVVEDFRREAQLLATLDHPNLPKVADLFTTEGKHYLVMEFIEGQTLEQIMDASADFLAEDLVLNWIGQLCDALDYLHSQHPPVIYRDLKPSNVMQVQGTDRVKLIDFGIARFFKPGKMKDTMAIGTPGYAAPEQYGRGQTDPRSDIYSLGVMLLVLLTRYDPSQSPFRLPRAREINPAVSPAIEVVILKATAPQMEERFNSAREFKEALFAASVSPAISAPSRLLAFWQWLSGKSS